MIPVQHRLHLPSTPTREALKQFGRKLRVSIPAIVVSFDEVRQVVSVQPAVTEVIRKNAVPTIVELPQIDDVPIGLPSAGGWDMTFPIQQGDECDLVFQDMAFDLWWQNGGVQNQPDGVLFRHNLFDAVAWFGLRNQQRVLANYSTTSVQIRNEDQSTVLDLADDAITATAQNVNIVTPVASVAASGGTTQFLMAMAFLTYFVETVIPTLVAHGITLPPVPTNSLTTVLKAE